VVKLLGYGEDSVPTDFERSRPDGANSALADQVGREAGADYTYGAGQPWPIGFNSNSTSRKRLFTVQRMWHAKVRSKMLAKDFIRTCRQEELEEHFDKSVPKGRFARFLARMSGAEAEGLKLDVPYIKFGLNTLVRVFGRDYLNRVAAWKWLNPHKPCLCAIDIPRLKKQLGMEDLDESEFVENLKQGCQEILREHPQLGLWIISRIALLDFVTQANVSFAAESANTALLLRHRQVQLVSYLASSAPMGGVAGEAEELAAAALTAASQELCLCLSSGPCEYNANLMVPIAFDDVARFFGSASAAARAKAVWSALQPFDKCLVIAAETERAGHLGFWAPLARGANDEYLAGAPEAFMSRSSTAVFKDDLPDLAGFPAAVIEAWRRYMKDHFRQDLFISVPFMVPQPMTVGTKVACILNVNVLSKNEAWRRANHKEWLNPVVPRVAPFIEIALYATLIRQEAGRRSDSGYIQIDSGMKTWDNLPGARVERLLEEGDKNGPPD
jgi:hypothetical protein